MMTAERRHTPGPWGDNTKTVLVRGATWLGQANWDDAEAKANEALIRAAPDLLGALKDARDSGLIYWDPLTVRGQNSKDEMMARIETAIAKAEGRA